MKSVLDLTTGIWDFDISSILEEYDPYLNIEVDFIDNGNSYVEFDKLSFGLIIKENNVVKHNSSFPPENVTYLSTDQDYLENYEIEDLKPDTEYHMTFWAINGGTKYEDYISIKTLRPPQPGSLWYWDDDSGSWIAPLETAGIKDYITEENTN